VDLLTRLMLSTRSCSPLAPDLSDRGILVVIRARHSCGDWWWGQSRLSCERSWRGKEELQLRHHPTRNTHHPRPNNQPNNHLQLQTRERLRVQARSGRRSLLENRS